MSFSPDDSVTEDEDLFRAIHPNHWSYKNGGRISSACFKQSDGPSVDRDGGRDQKDIISALDERKGTDFGIAELDAEICLVETNVHVEPEPEEENIYHATIYKSPDLEKPPTTGQARTLAKQCWS